MASDLTRERWRRFKAFRRAYLSLLLLAGAFCVSLFSEVISNDKPLWMRYGGETFFPAFKFYPANAFGLPFATEADYLALRDDSAFLAAGGSMTFPPVPWGPLRPNLDLEGYPPHKPTARHWLGTDTSGRDVFSRLLYGFRIGMAFALFITALTAALGILIGGLQGYLGGKTDLAVQRFTEIWSALPFLYVVILLGAVYGRSFTLLVFIVAVFSWIGLSYYMRGEFYRLRSLTYVRAAQALGVPERSIFLRHILPNALTPAVTLIPFQLISGISVLTSLDFLGFGLQPPTPSWGELLRQGLDNLHAPWLAFTAVTALFVTLLLATFVGEGVREAFDPKADARLE